MGEVIVPAVVTVVVTVVMTWLIRRRLKKNRQLKDLPTSLFVKNLLTANEVRSFLPKPKDFIETIDIDRNEVAFVGEDLSKLWYCPKHRYTLDDLHMHAKDPGLDSMYFSCKNKRDEDGQNCWASKIIDRAEFWMGIKRDEEQWVDPEWERNYAAHMYNQNKKAFEKEWAAMKNYGLTILSDAPKAPVFHNYKD